MIHWLLNRFQDNTNSLPQLLATHFLPVEIDEVTILERQFPHRVRADLQCAVEACFTDDIQIDRFSGVRCEYSHDGVNISQCLIPSDHYEATAVPPEYEELDIGETKPIRVLKHGLWLLTNKETRFAAVLGESAQHGIATGMLLQIAVPNTSEGIQVAESIFKRMEDAILRARSYRGKILSLETSQNYTGKSTGITVHQLKDVAKSEVILPEETISLLDRNVIHFVKQRDRLAEFNQSTKKGLLFYGPPGTGKTHTIHYLAKALRDHTTFLISAEQVGLLEDYMTLARLLQPSVVVLEDVDLIARDRNSINNGCEEVLLNKLLNEMDGLKEDSDIIFILTTNRPETLEEALAARPGRVDQAIEFPLPDEVGRKKLISLYSDKLELNDSQVNDLAKRTDNVSAAFIKELMRRIVQYHIERKGDGDINESDIDQALSEMLTKSGPLNLRLLGAER